MVALGVARDPDAVEALAQRAHGGEQLGGAVELAGRLRRVAGGDEQLVDPRVAQAREHLVQVGAVAHEPGGQMRNDRVALPRKPLAERERRLEPLAR